jgi:AcrR family transcriptional regulator
MKSCTDRKSPGRPRAFSCEAVLDTAMRLFARKGYTATSMSDLTEATGVNRPSIYAAFGSKGKLFSRAVARYMDAGDAHVAQSLASATAREGVERLLRDGVTMFTSPEGVGGCFFTQGPLTGPGTSDAMKQDFHHRRATIQRALARRFERAIESGELARSTSPKDLARFYSVVMQGIALQAQHGSTRAELLRVVEIAMDRWPKAKKTPSPPGRGLG